MKYIIVLGDGMADEPIGNLGGRTPLQAADTKIPVCKGVRLWTGWRLMVVAVC